MMLAPGFIAMNQSNFLVPTHAMWAGFIFFTKLLQIHFVIEIFNFFTILNSYNILEIW